MESQLHKFCWNRMSQLMLMCGPSSFRIVACLVRAQPVPFFLNILKWLLVAIPATWTNSWLSYVQNKLALAYRTRLTEAVMGQYLGNDKEDDKIFYKLGMTSYHPFTYSWLIFIQRTSMIGYRIRTS